MRTEITPLTSQDKITFKSSNNKVVTVNKKGKIKALKVGETVIKAESGKKVIKLKVTVKKK